MRVSKEDMDKATFIPKGNKIQDQTSLNSNKDQDVEWFDVQGKPCTIEADMLAKKVVSPRGNSYFLKINYDGQLLNPFDKDYERRSFRIAHQQGLNKDKTYRLVKCSKSGFDNYIEFLKTKKPVFLTQAERGI